MLLWVSSIRGLKAIAYPTYTIIPTKWPGFLLYQMWSQSRHFCNILFVTSKQQRRGLIPSVVPASLMRGVRHIRVYVDVCFSRKHIYNNARSQQYAGDPGRYIIRLIIFFYQIEGFTVWFFCCWGCSLFQLTIMYDLMRSRTIPLISTYV